MCPSSQASRVDLPLPLISRRLCLSMFLFMYAAHANEHLVYLIWLGFVLIYNEGGEDPFAFERKWGNSDIQSFEGCSKVLVHAVGASHSKYLC